MRLGIFARTFPGATPSAVLARAREAGYETVQYNMACSGLPSLPRLVAPEAIAALRDAAAETGVGLAALSATYNMAHPDASVRRAGAESLGALAAVARAVGIPVLTLCTGSRDAADQWAPHPDNATPAAWRTLLASLESAVDVAESYDVVLGIEPEPANVIDSAARARALLDEIGSSRLGIVFDAANLLDAATLRSPAATRDAIARALDLLADRIALVHAKDRAADGAVVPAGSGAIDYDAYLAALGRAGVDAPLITHGLDAAAAARVALFLRARLTSARATR